MTLNDTTTERNSVIENWMKDIQRAARRVAHNWPTIVESEDLAQDIRVRLLESPGSVEVLASMEDGVRYRAFVELGHQIANKERASYEYFSGQFRYSTNEVRDALEAGALQAIGSGLKSSWSAEDYVASGSDHADTVLGMVSMEQDLRVALAKLADTNEVYHEIIHRRYVDGEGGMETKERVQLHRALAELTVVMNHSHKTPSFRIDPEDEYHPTKGWDSYNDWASDREEYEDQLREIHEPKPELVSVGPDGLGTFNITRGPR